MRTLYESLLDTEDVIMKRVEKNTWVIQKQKIIDYICQHYQLQNHRGTFVSIPNRLKINKDLTVDLKIKPGQVLYLVPKIDDNDTELPTGDLFTWGTVWNVRLYSGRNLTSLKGFPRKCNYVEIKWLNNMSSLEGAPDEMHYLEIGYNKKLKNLKGLENVKGLEHMSLSILDELESLEGLPDIKYSLSCYECPKLKKFVTGEIPHLKVSKCPKVTQEEYDKIKHEESRYSWLKA